MKQTDIYTEALICLRSILQADHPEFKNWIDWLERDIQDWNQRREVAHHLRAYGGNLVFLSALKLLEQLTEKGLLTVDEAEKSRIELERKLRPTLLFA